MKINPLDAHDRYLHFTKQSFDIGECCQNLMDQHPFRTKKYDEPVYFYAFAHARTDDDGVTKRLIWQPRLSRPKAQENSMLFKCYPSTDLVKIIWIIPASELWDTFKRGKMTENKMICDSIEDFKCNKAKLEASDEEDLPDSEIDKIYKAISQEAKLNSWAAYLAAF